MNLFLISIKLFAISIIFGFLNQAQALEFKPTHIITDNSPVEISGEELVWSDNTGILKLNDILKLISDFKNPALISKTVDLNTQEA